MRVALALFVVLSGAPSAGLAQPAARGNLRPPTAQAAAKMYRWQRRRSSYESLASRVAPPSGFARVKIKRGSYAHWLRHLPLLGAGSPVKAYDGRTILRGGHRALAAVVDLDVGKRDRQQCMDTIMRLRGEYHYQRGKPDRTIFAWAGGKRFGFAKWRRGLRPVKSGRRWFFEQKARPWSGYRSFRRYLSYMFSWTGSIHQTREPRVKPQQLAAGSFFLQPGSPGHAVIVLDLARDSAGKTVALIGQGFMPAQDMHLLKPSRGGVWFDVSPSLKLIQTPLWPRPFRWRELRRFRY